MVIAIVGSAIIAMIVFGVGYWIWMFTRPKKQTWKARIYRITDGTKILKDKEGNILNPNELNDLQAFTKDIIEKQDKGKGVEVYFLQKMKKSLPPVTAECVEYWSDKDKEVPVLYNGEGYTLLKRSYDKKAGQAIFNPIPYDRMTMIANQIVTRKERINKKSKDLLTALAPYFLAVMIFIALVSIGYFASNAFVKISDNQVKAADSLNLASQNVANKLGEVASIIDEGKVKEALKIKEEEPPQEIKDEPDLSVTN